MSGQVSSAAPCSRPAASTRGRVAALSLIGCAALGASTLADNAAAVAEPGPNTAFLSPVTGVVTGTASAPPSSTLGSQRPRREAQPSDSASTSGAAWAGLSVVACAAIAAHGAKNNSRRRVQRCAEAGFHQTSIIECGNTKSQMTKQEEKEFLEKRCEGLRKYATQTEEEFMDEVDELTWQWGRHLLPYVNKKRDDIASYKRRTIIKQKGFFQQLRLFKPLAMKYPTLLKRLNIMQYPDIENKDFEVNGEWIHNEETIAGFTYEDFAGLTSGDNREDWDTPKIGALIEGKVAALVPEGAFVEIGTKSWAFMPLTNISLAPITKAKEVLEVGQEIMAQVVDLGAESAISGDPWAKQVVLTMTTLQADAAWDEIDRIQRGEAEDSLVEVEVRAMRTWGAIVQTNSGFEGIIPNSELADRVGDTSLVGQKITVEIRDIDRSKSVSGGAGPRDFAITFSYKNAATKELAKELEIGTVLDAKVLEIKAASLDIEVRGTRCSMRKVDVSSQVNFNLVDLFEPGEEIKVYVVSKIEKSGEIRLSTRALERTRGQMLEDKKLVFANAEETGSKYLATALKKSEAALAGLENILADGDTEDTPAPRNKGSVMDLDDELDDGDSF